MLDNTNVEGGDGRPKYLHILHSSLLRITSVRLKENEKKKRKPS